MTYLTYDEATALAGEINRGIAEGKYGRMRSAVQVLHNNVTAPHYAVAVYDTDYKDHTVTSLDELLELAGKKDVSYEAYIRVEMPSERMGTFTEVAPTLAEARVHLKEMVTTYPPERGRVVGGGINKYEMTEVEQL